MMPSECSALPLGSLSLQRSASTNFSATLPVSSVPTRLCEFPHPCSCFFFLEFHARNSDCCNC